MAKVSLQTKSLKYSASDVNHYVGPLDQVVKEQGKKSRAVRKFPVDQTCVRDHEYMGVSARTTSNLLPRRYLEKTM
jgi:hypothetical protein